MQKTILKDILGKNNIMFSEKNESVILERVNLMNDLPLEEYYIISFNSIERFCKHLKVINGHWVASLRYRETEYKILGEHLNFLKSLTRDGYNVGLRLPNNEATSFDVLVLNSTITIPILEV